VVVPVVVLVPVLVVVVPVVDLPPLLVVVLVVPLPCVVVPSSAGGGGTGVVESPLGLSTGLILTFGSVTTGFLDEPLTPLVEVLPEVGCGITTGSGKGAVTGG
jgi:hypothetical protein